MEEKKQTTTRVSKKEYDKLMEQFEKAMATAAHHENLSKYYQGEYDKALKYRSQTCIESIIPSLDSFELAFKFKAPNQEAENYKAGFEYVYKMLLEALKNEGLEVVVPKVDDEFDSTTQAIVDTVETNDEKQVNKIAEVLLNGYKLKDRLLRPSNVKVYTLKTIHEEKN